MSDSVHAEVIIGSQPNFPSDTYVVKAITASNENSELLSIEETFANLHEHVKRKKNDLIIRSAFKADQRVLTQVQINGKPTFRWWTGTNRSDKGYLKL